MRARCNAILLALLGETHAPLWWESRNKAFDMLTAQQQWDKNPGVVYRYLMLQASY